uniref:protein-arginine deiminase n=1 Tax=Crocodylus porosus TaxID=8502 RepID=A0A7M4FJ05_CROPO
EPSASNTQGWLLHSEDGICALPSISAPKDAMWFDAQGSPGVDIYIVHTPQPMQMPASEPRWPLGAGAEVVVTMGRPSDDVDDHKVGWSCKGEVPLGFSFSCDIAEVSLEADTTRSGTVQKKVTDKRNWTWGPGGQGAVLLVNCDKDDPTSKTMDNKDQRVQTYKDLRDMSLMVLRTRGPGAVFANHKLVLHVSGSDADKVGVFYAHSEYSAFLGLPLPRNERPNEHTFYVEGLAFPDADFSGLVSLHATMLDTSLKSLPETPIFTDTVVFRVAPWIMTPNTLQPLEIYVCSFSDNTDFVEAISNLAQKTRCKLTICPELENQNDSWIQDEMEFGYVQAPHKTFPVVFDSPRNGGLKGFPKSILGPDFGYVTREPLRKGISSLDSFGNLEVSPPVKVKGKEYPLGRILIGSSFPRVGGRRMTKVVRDFLYAQRVQAPVELFSDWLLVGHVDEFLSFVPAHDRQGFRLLLASPSACYKLLKEKQEEGHGKAQMFEEEILADETLRKENDYFQSCIDWNRDILRQELGLSPKDIIDIPQLFNMKDNQAEAYFPNMVNTIVLGKDLGIPKPFGPIINGQCCLEEKVRSLLEPLGLTCTFINDYFTYHEWQGEVHCGTNVLRKPFSFKWWNMIP